jgi:hypothetical protein
MLWNKESGIFKPSTIGSFVINESDPLVAGAKDVVGTNKFLMHVFRDSGIVVFNVHDFFRWEEAHRQILNANPLGFHLAAKQFPSVGIGSWPLDDFWIAVA